MIQSPSSVDTIFSPFEESLAAYSFPDKFTFPFDYEPHPLSLLAVEKLQSHLENQDEWEHNFGLKVDQEGAVIGKMFGVLVVRTEDDEIGYLSAFSGKLAGGNHHSKFVPPIFDGMADGGFLNTGMEELSRINLQIKELENKETDIRKEVDRLKKIRKAHSVSLQQQIFDQYNFLNQDGEEKVCAKFSKVLRIKIRPREQENVPLRNYFSMLFSKICGLLRWQNSGGDYLRNPISGNTDISIRPAVKNVSLF